MADGDSETRQHKASWPIKALAWIVILSVVVALVVLNGQRVPVRPFGQLRLNQVLAAPLVLGLIAGWIARSRLTAWSARRTARRAERSQPS